jgi:hypothetical protein
MSWDELNDILRQEQGQAPRPDETAERLQNLLMKLQDSIEEEAIKIKELSLMKLCELYRETR